MILIRKDRHGNVSMFRDIEDINHDIHVELAKFYGNHSDDCELALSQQLLTEQDADYLGMVRVS